MDGSVSMKCIFRSYLVLSRVNFLSKSNIFSLMTEVLVCMMDHLPHRQDKTSRLLQQMPFFNCEMNVRTKETIHIIILQPISKKRAPKSIH